MAHAHEVTAGTPIASATMMPVTPTVDATVTALNKEKLVHENDWWWNYGATILTSLISTFTLAAAGIFTVVRYFHDLRDTREKQEAETKRLAEDRQAEREKRAEEHFQVAVEGLSSAREEAKIGAAITLRTFLRPGYEQFYTQTFDIAVAHLRLPRTSQSSNDPTDPLPLPTLSQALIMVFKEAFPLARNLQTSSPQSLDATGIQLDHAHLREVDLARIWMPLASLHSIDLRKAHLSEAHLRDTDLRKANLRKTDLRKADLIGAKLQGADFSGANLEGAKLVYANLGEVNFHEANLSAADLFHADLTRTNLGEAQSLEETKLHAVKGLTKEQLAACKAKGAIIDEDSTANRSQTATAHSSPPQSNHVQAASTSPAQESTPPSNPGQQEPEL
jgi:large-conductance mechanosensitive channel